MPVGIGASGVIGIAFETTAGTYTAPTKFFPIRSENLMFKQNVNPRRVIRGIAAPLGFTKGDGIVEGDISMEVLSDVLPYFLYSSRATIVKTGAGPWVYTAKGNNSGFATTGRTMSITVVRNGAIFGYTGCMVGNSKYSIEDGVLSVTHKIMGQEEATQANPSAVYTGATTPFGMGTYVLTVNAVTDQNIGGITIDIEDNISAEYRLNTTTGADVIHWGENTTKFSMDRDFLDKTSYASYRATTPEAYVITCTNGGEIVAYTIPVGTMTMYEVSLSSVGDLVAAKVEAEGAYDATLGAPWQIAVTSTTANIT
jgi:hypothetical protein